MFILGYLESASLVDFLLVSIDLFSLGVTAEALRMKIDRKLAISLQRDHFDQKFQVEGIARHQSTYDNHLSFVGKRVVDFLLVLIELFSQGVTAEALPANIG